MIEIELEFQPYGNVLKINIQIIGLEKYFLL